MPKFYVTSGDVKALRVCETAKQAVIDVLKYMDDQKRLSHYVKVSEMGFESVNDDDIMFLTEQVLETAGIKSDFESYSPGDEEILM